jgi:hypothetical protein
MDVSERDLKQFRIWHHSGRSKKHSFSVERLCYLQCRERSLMLQQGRANIAEHLDDFLDARAGTRLHCPGHFT